MPPATLARRFSSVRFREEVAEADTSEASYAVATTSSGSGAVAAGPADPVALDIGFLCPEAKYRAVIFPVSKGSRLENPTSDTLGVMACLMNDPCGSDGVVVACQVDTAAGTSGHVTACISMDVINSNGPREHKSFEISYQIMPPEKGTPSIKSFVHCIEKKATSNTGLLDDP